MKPFDLEAAKRGEPIVTRDGRKAKFIAHVPEANKDSQVVFLVGSDLYIRQTSGLGKRKTTYSELDLFMAPPPMRSINGHEYPEPVREPLEAGKTYFLAGPVEDELCGEYHWDGADLEVIWLRRGLIHLTREAAEAHARAIIFAGGGEV